MLISFMTHELYMFIILTFPKYEMMHWCTQARRSQSKIKTNNNFIRDDLVSISFPFGKFQIAFWQKRSIGEPFTGTFKALKPSLFISNPELIRSVLIKDSTRLQDRGFRVLFHLVFHFQRFQQKFLIFFSRYLLLVSQRAHKKTGFIISKNTIDKKNKIDTHDLVKVKVKA